MSGGRGGRCRERNRRNAGASGDAGQPQHPRARGGSERGSERGEEQVERQPAAQQMLVQVDEALAEDRHRELAHEPDQQEEPRRVQGGPGAPPGPDTEHDEQGADHQQRAARRQPAQQARAPGRELLCGPV